MNDMLRVDKENGFVVDIAVGGDGDLGEMLMYLMDVVFERRDLKR